MTPQQKESVQVWDRESARLIEATYNMKLDLESLTDAQLIDMPFVTADFIGFAPFMFNVLHPKEHPRLRKLIAYMDHLRNLQGAALWRDVDKNNDIIQRLKTKLNSMQHG